MAGERPQRHSHPSPSGATPIRIMQVRMRVTNPRRISPRPSTVAWWFWPTTMRKPDARERRRSLSVRIDREVAGKCKSSSLSLNHGDQFVGSTSVSQVEWLSPDQSKVASLGISYVVGWIEYDVKFSNPSRAFPSQLRDLPSFSSFPVTGCFGSASCFISH